MEQNKVIVIGGNHHNTLGVIRSLGYYGLRPYLIVITDHKKPYICKSRFIDNYEILTSTKDLLRCLLRLKDDFIGKAVVLSCADFVTAELDSNKELLQDNYYLPVGNGNLVEIMNKDYMSRIANDCGILTPNNVELKDISFSNNRKYIIKPLKSIEGSKADIAIIKDKRELDKYLSSEHCENIQIQEFIEKELEFQLIGCSLNAGEKIIIPGVSIILRQPDNTNTGFLKYVALEKFSFKQYDECAKFIHTIGYSGLFSLEFLRDKSGKDYFMEINMRNDGNAICVTAAGINLPYIWYSYCIGSNDWKREIANEVSDTVVMPEFDDFVNVLKHKISITRWIKDINHTDHFMEYDRRDIKPFIYGVKQQLANYLKIAINKIHSHRR